MKILQIQHLEDKKRLKKKMLKFDKTEDNVLYIIYDKGDLISWKDIYEELPTITKDTIKRAIQKLEKKNLIKSQKGEGDKNLISLKTGKMSWEKIIKIIGEYRQANKEVMWENVRKI